MARSWVETQSLSSVGNLADAELLDRYVVRRDEAAFEALVVRHGPMVLRVCRGVLANAGDAADAFQATFLVLARRAGSIRRRDSAASWLHGVARRVAARARVQVARRRRHEHRAAGQAPGSGPGSVEAEDLRPLDEEIARLPVTLREAIVLCYLEGMTYEVAAGHLGVPEATVRGRLARAKARLRSGLARRGVAGPGPLPCLAIRPQLADATIATIRSVSTGTAAPAVVSSSVLNLAAGAQHVMTFERLRWMAVAVVLGLGVPATGALAWAQRANQPVRNPPAVPAEAKRPTPQPPAAPTRLGYGDGQPDGKRSLGGSGHWVEFTLPAAGRQVGALRIHGSRYGQDEAPRESFLIYFLNEAQTEVIATRLAPYSLFVRGPERWVDVVFATPVGLPQRSWVALDFRPGQTKGIYLSFDASTGGKHSEAGLIGMKTRKVDFGDWMVELVLDPAAAN